LRPSTAPRKIAALMAAEAVLIPISA